MKRRISVFARAMLAAALVSVAAQDQAVVEIQWWHSMTGALNDRLNAPAIHRRSSRSSKWAPRR